MRYQSGCSIYAYRKVIGMTFEDAMKLTSKDMTEMLGTSLTPSRMKCAVLSLEVLQKLILSLKK
jgi:NifU-like protein involved in Fe-S cluster formation